MSAGNFIILFYQWITRVSFTVLLEVKINFIHGNWPSLDILSTGFMKTQLVGLLE